MFRFKPRIPFLRDTCEKEKLAQPAEHCSPLAHRPPHNLGLSLHLQVFLSFVVLLTHSEWNGWQRRQTCSIHIRVRQQRREQDFTIALSILSSLLNCEGWIIIWVSNNWHPKNTILLPFTLGNQLSSWKCIFLFLNWCRKCTSYQPPHPPLQKKKRHIENEVHLIICTVFYTYIVNGLSTLFPQKHASNIFSNMSASLKLSFLFCFLYTFFALQFHKEGKSINPSTSEGLMWDNSSLALCRSSLWQKGNPELWHSLGIVLTKKSLPSHFPWCLRVLRL